MKKIVALLVCILMTCITVCAFASTTTGPKSTVTVATGTKASQSANPTMEISTLTVGGNGQYTFWIKYNSNDEQVSPAYYFSTKGVKTIYYMLESRNDGYVVKDGSYSARFRSNSSVPANEKGTIELKSFKP